MKKLLFILAAFTLLTALSCKKNNNDDDINPVKRKVEYKVTAAQSGGTIFFTWPSGYTSDETNCDSLWSKVFEMYEGSNLYLQYAAGSGASYGGLNLIEIYIDDVLYMDSTYRNSEIGMLMSKVPVK